VREKSHSLSGLLPPRYDEAVTFHPGAYGIGAHRMGKDVATDLVARRQPLLQAAGHRLVTVGRRISKLATIARRDRKAGREYRDCRSAFALSGGASGHDSRKFAHRVNGDVWLVGRYAKRSAAPIDECRTHAGRFGTDAVERVVGHE
jgi:hypothetical protein